MPKNSPYPDDRARPPHAHTLSGRLKTFVVAQLAAPDEASILALLVAKVIYTAWPKFRSA